MQQRRHYQQKRKDEGTVKTLLRRYLHDLYDQSALQTRNRQYCSRQEFMASQCILCGHLLVTHHLDFIIQTHAVKRSSLFCLSECLCMTSEKY